MKRLYTFQCPMCQKLFRQWEPGEPMCTGPSETRDDHDMQIMVLKSVERLGGFRTGVDLPVSPILAQARADGPLIIPGTPTDPNWTLANWFADNEEGAIA